MPPDYRGWSAGRYRACPVQGLVNRSGQVAQVVLGDRGAVGGESEAQAGAGEVVVDDPGAEGLAFVEPEDARLAGVLLHDAEPVAARVRAGGGAGGLGGGG